MKILGYNEPFDEIRFGPFTGNVTLMRFNSILFNLILFIFIIIDNRWFKKLNAHFRVEGKASMFYKPVGTCKTAGINGKIAKENLETLLHSNDYAFVYHCYNHYCCPIGYEKEPLDHKKIFKTNGNVDFLDWILVADTSKKYQSIHCVKWDDIDKDLNLKSPEYLNIRRAELGVQVKKLKYKAEQSGRTNERNLHCIIQFKRLDNSYISTHSSDSSSKFSLTESTTDESEENDVED